MADLLVALALLTFAGVAGLVMVVLLCMWHQRHWMLRKNGRRIKNERVHNIVWCADYF